ncbi:MULTISPECIES: DUF2057 domain-containing protein [Shewanella]|uniref:DUF2057 domain-containing protein n=1 Tax=Shewanella psychromarinicola TaxID=2487742 RepID=A0A3N4DWU7_9GAMM|nr:DUF2057 domain-containing protein [Shewanella psychromarinicola]AZG35672.1 DUF2057 domain-containing protein [Shewanella psychromarinicola]MCL1081530.1 DUF2057 domain-containing protein [Shewanella psychromarinicola]RPA30405.1 DUF2057 domain-containing protein [Shewanella psychromarinicola]
MKSLFTTSALLALLSSSSVLAANLTIPMSFEYLALDGTEVETSMFNHQSDLALTNGTHKIAIRYYDVVDDSFSDSQTFVKSTPLILTLMVDGDHQYQLQAAEGKVIKNPKAFAKKPQISITRQDNGSVTYSVKQTDFTDESFMTSLFQSKKQHDIETLSASATSNASQSVQTLPVIADVATATMSAPDVTPVPAATAQKPSPAKAEQMLQYWWLQADDKTRKEFMGWAIKQL